MQNSAERKNRAVRLPTEPLQSTGIHGKTQVLKHSMMNHGVPAVVLMTPMTVYDSCDTICG